MAKTGDELLSALRDTSVDFSQLAKLLDITPENRGTFWKNLIELLKSRDNPLDGEGSSNSDEILYDNEDAVFNFINYYCDLADKTTEEGEVYLSYIFDALKQIYIDTNGDPSEEVSFWNYSVQQMVDHYMEYFCSETDQDTPLVGGLDYTRRHIKNANAGLSFRDTNWVEPNFNVNDKTYDQVRGHDEVNDILANAHKMQFTHTRLQEDIEGKGGYTSDEELTDSTYAVPSEENANDEALNKWIRLLMPQYGRRVEIEDLDRNFWVIAQVIAALSGFLFDDDSPIAEMFKHLLNEIIQLWENVMYLWAEAAITSQKVCTDVRVITLPVPNTVEQPYRKFDNFSYEYRDTTEASYELYKTYDLQVGEVEDEVLYIENDREVTTSEYAAGSVFKLRQVDTGTNFKPFPQILSESEIKKRIEFLKDKYSDENLVIIPFERLRNYKHNWYGCEYYRCIFTYHRGTNTWKTYHLRTGFQNSNDFLIGVLIPLAPIWWTKGTRQVSDAEDDNRENFYNLFDSLYFHDYVYGIHKNDDEYSYDYIAPLSTYGTKDISDDKRYYGNLRTKVDIMSDEIELLGGGVDLSTEDIIINNINLNIYDANYEMINGGEQQVAQYTASTTTGNISQKSDSVEDGYIVFYLINHIIRSLPDDMGTLNFNNINKAVYMGETASYYNVVKAPIQTDVAASILGIILEPYYDTTYTNNAVHTESFTSTALVAAVNEALNRGYYSSDSNIIIGYGVCNNSYGTGSESFDECYYYFDKSSGSLTTKNVSVTVGENSHVMSPFHGSCDGSIVIAEVEGNNIVTITNSNTIFNARAYMSTSYSSYDQMTQIFLYSYENNGTLYNSNGDFDFYIYFIHVVYTKTGETNWTYYRIPKLFRYTSGSLTYINDSNIESVLSGLSSLTGDITVPASGTTVDLGVSTAAEAAEKTLKLYGQNEGVSFYPLRNSAWATDIQNGKCGTGFLKEKNTNKFYGELKYTVET